MSTDVIGFTRKDGALVNHDIGAFRSAKARMEQSRVIQSMEKRIHKLECAIESLQQTCNEKIK